MSPIPKPLSHFADLASGGTPSKKNAKFWGGEIPWLTPKDMSGFDGATADSVHECAIGNGTKLATAESLFIAVRGMSLHNEIRIVRPRKVMAFNQDIKAIIPKKGTDSTFLYYALSNKIPQLLSSVHAAGHGTGVLSTDLLNSMSIPEFEFDAQVSIGSRLSAFDDKIEINRRMNETLEATARAIFRDWFVDFGPTRRKMEGATGPLAILGSLISNLEEAATLAAVFPATLGDDGLPVGWSEKAISDLCETVGGATPSTKNEEFWTDGTHAWATPKDLSKLPGIFLRDTERTITDKGLAKISSALSPAGSVMMSSRAPIGYVAIASAPVAVNQGFIVMRPSEAFPTAYGYFWCLVNMDRIKSNANGSTFQEISKKNFRPMLATSPSPEVMDAFVEITAPMLDLIRTHEEENETLAATRDLLLPKLMSGDIRLSDAEAVA